MSIKLTHFYVIDGSYYTPTGTILADFFGLSNDESCYPRDVKKVLNENPGAYVVTFSEIRDVYWEKMEVAETVNWQKIDPSVFEYCKSLVKKGTFKILGGDGFFSQENNQMLSFYFQRGGEFFTALFHNQTTMPDLENSIASL